jgi:hypothetical protein
MTRRPQRRALATLEAKIARALRDDDPWAAFVRLGEDASLSADLRARVRAADPDGVRMAALLVARLRFERLLRGSPAAEAWFEEDPSAFAAAFRRYHRTVAPTAFFPPEEARLFDAWRAGEPSR